MTEVNKADPSLLFGISPAGSRCAHARKAAQLRLALGRFASSLLAQHDKGFKVRGKVDGGGVELRSTGQVRAEFMDVQNTNASGRRSTMHAAREHRSGTECAVRIP